MAVTDFYQTPPELFEPLHDEFDFQVDVAADATNHRVGEWWGPGGMWHDALECAWAPLRCWMNPPYSQTGRWVAKAADEAQRGATVVGLVPFMPSEGWWHHVERAVEVRRIPHRVRFLNADGSRAGTARFASAVVVWRPQPGIMGVAHPRYVSWSWRAIPTEAVA